MALEHAEERRGGVRLKMISFWGVIYVRYLVATQDSILVRRVLNFSQTSAEKFSHWYMEVFHGFFFLTVLAGAIWCYVRFVSFAICPDCSNKG
jgi:hypothetical protein